MAPYTFQTNGNPLPLLSGPPVPSGVPLQDLTPWSPRRWWNQRSQEFCEEGLVPILSPIRFSPRLLYQVIFPTCNASPSPAYLNVGRSIFSMPRDFRCRFVLLESAIPSSSGFIRSVTVAEIMCFILILRALIWFSFFLKKNDLARLDSKCKKGLKCTNLKLHWCAHEYSDFSQGACTALG